MGFWKANLASSSLFASEKLDHAPSWEKLEPGTIAVAHRDLRLEMHRI